MGFFIRKKAPYMGATYFENEELLRFSHRNNSHARCLIFQRKNQRFILIKDSSKICSELKLTILWYFSSWFSWFQISGAFWLKIHKN